MRKESLTGRAVRLAALPAALAALAAGWGEQPGMGWTAAAQEAPAAQDEPRRDRTARAEPGAARSAAPAGGWAAAAEAPSADEVDAHAELEPVANSGVHGTVSFMAQDDGGMTVVAVVEGLEPGRHGFHVHETGDCSAPDASSADGHFAPSNDPHGAPRDPASERHAGDLGNVVADETGRVLAGIGNAELELDGEYGIVDRAVIVHRMPDDLESQPSGDAGDRVACGVIRRTGDGPRPGGAEQQGAERG